MGLRRSDTVPLAGLDPLAPSHRRCLQPSKCCGAGAVGKGRLNKVKRNPFR